MIECVVDAGCELGEGPLWDPGSNRLYWVDIIAHRLQTTMRADRIVVVDDGGIAEVGTRDELIAQGGHFAKMWEAGAVANGS